MIARGAQIISFMILVRVLTTESFGLYGVVTSLIFLAAQIGHLGLRQSGALMIGQERLADGQVAALYMACWPLLVAITGCGIWLTGSLEHFDTESALVPTFVGLAAILGIVLTQGVFLGRGQTKLFAAVENGPRVLLMVLTVIAWLTDLLTLETAFWIFAGAFLIFLPYSVMMMLRRARDVHLSLSNLPPMISFGLLYALSATVVLLQGRIGLFFLADSTGAAAAGQFFAAQRAGEIFLELATAAGLVLFSDTARSADRNASVRNAIRTALILFGIFAVCGVGAATFAPLIVRILLGQQYADAASSLAIILLGLGPAAAVRIFNSAIAGLGRPYISLLAVLFGVIANIGACFYFVPLFGVDGAAMALVFGQTVSALAYMGIFLKLRSIDINRPSIDTPAK